jgi:hypothetical protein
MMKSSQSRKAKTINLLASFKINIMNNSIIQLYSSETIMFNVSITLHISRDCQFWDQLIHKDHKFARHIPNLFFKVVKILIQVV